MGRTQTTIKCKFCGNDFQRALATVKLHGAKFCSRRCSGQARVVPMTESERKAAKSEYDARRRNGPERARILAEKRGDYYKNRERYRRYWAKKRKQPGYKKMMRDYLAGYWTPELKALKKDYDRKFRAKRQFGPFWESHYLIQLINDEVLRQTTKYDCRISRGYYNKAQLRRRNAEAKGA